MPDPLEDAQRPRSRGLTVDERDVEPGVPALDRRAGVVGSADGVDEGAREELRRDLTNVELRLGGLGRAGEDDVIVESVRAGFLLASAETSWSLSDGRSYFAMTWLRAGSRACSCVRLAPGAASGSS